MMIGVRYIGYDIKVIIYTKQAMFVDCILEYIRSIQNYVQIPHNYGNTKLCTKRSKYLQAGKNTVLFSSKKNTI